MMAGDETTSQKARPGRRTESNDISEDVDPITERIHGVKPLKSGGFSVTFDLFFFYKKKMRRYFVGL